MKRLKTYRHRTFQTPSGLRLLAYARGRLVMAGPEELVRQDVVRSLVEEYGYPLDSVFSEEPVARGTDNRRRADVLVRLPRAEVGRARLGDSSGEGAAVGAEGSYEQAARRVRALLCGIDSLQVVDLPPTLSVALDGESYEMKPLGFAPIDLTIAVALEEPQPRLPDGPGAIVAWVLGHGVTPTEERLARTLSLEPLVPTDPGSDELVAEVDYLLQLLEGPDAWVTGGLSSDGVDGWVLVRHVSEPFNVLVRASTRGDDWAVSVNRAAEAAKEIPLQDGRIADRRGLASLEVGAHVVVETTEGQILEGTVERIDGQTVFVRSSGELVAAELSLGKKRNWVVGVVDEARAVSDARDGTQHSEDLSTFLVVECKAPGVAVTQEVVGQGASYAETVGATFVVATNGEDTRSFLRDAGRVTPVEDIPTYVSACEGPEYEVVKADTPSPRLPMLPESARERPDLAILHARRRGSVGADLAPIHWWPVLKLQDSLIHGPWETAAPYRGYGVEILADMGLRLHTAGNAGGGKWGGFYRDVLIRDPAGDERVMALMVGATRKTVSHSHWGNSRGRSQLIVALSRDAKFESHLQVDLAKSLEVKGAEVCLWHSGRMTAGRGGVKTAKVLEHVSKSVPTLVNQGRVDLGRVPTRNDVEWGDVVDTLARLGAYVSAREQLKIAVKSQRRADL